MSFMQDFSYDFGLRMYECGQKLNYTNGLAQEILSFWNEDYNLNTLGLGCLVVCALVSFDLVDADGGLLIDNAKAYLAAHGADDPSSKIVIEIYTACRQNVSGLHHCEVALKVADCFREAVWLLAWTPDINAMFRARKSRVGC